MKVAIVHDDLVQWGGAERVLKAISDLFPEAPVYTSLFNYSNKNLVDAFKGKKIVTSFMQRIPGWKSFYKAMLPLYPIAFEQFDFSEFDLVISQTTRFSKAVITKPQTYHICYCHTPPRFLWNFSGERSPRILSFYFNFLRRFDKISSSRVDLFLAGSKNAKERISRVYQRDSAVLYPFVDESLKTEEGFEGGYYLLVARLNKYKRVDIAVEAFNKNGRRLKIVGTGPEKENLCQRAESNIEFLDRVAEETLANLIAGCRGLIVCAEEDFGLTPLEGQIFGKPVIAFGKGGTRETVIDKKTGVLFDEQTPESLESALKELDSLKIDPADCRQNAGKFSLNRFKRELLKTVEDSHLKSKELY